MRGLRQKKGNALSWKTLTIPCRQQPVSSKKSRMRSLEGREKISMKDLSSLRLKFLKETGQSYLSKTKKNLLRVKWVARIKILMSWDRSLKMKKHLLSKRSRISSRNMTLLWMNSLLVRSTMKEKRLWKIKRLPSKSKGLTSTTIKWSRRSNDTRRDSRVRKMMQPKYFQKEWIGFQVRRIHLRRSTSRREKPLRS